MKIKSGDWFYSGNAELLNQLGLRTAEGLKFKSWAKSTYELDYNTYIWMPRIDGQIKDGWQNEYKDGFFEIIIERNLDNKYHPIGLTHKHRYVFDKKEYCFIFRGVYELQPESDNRVRVLKQIKNEVDL